MKVLMVYKYADNSEDKNTSVNQKFYNIFVA